MEKEDNEYKNNEVSGETYAILPDLLLLTQNIQAQNKFQGESWRS